MWIDIHAHLYDKSEPALTECLQNALSNQVDIIINTATSLETGARVITQCSKSSMLYGIVGISPFDVENLVANWLWQLFSLIDNKKIIGIGETGLDNTNPRYPSMKTQIPIFAQQLELAGTSNLPIIVHSRGAEKEVLGFCKNHAVKKVLFHCFTGSIEVLREILDHGYYVSFSGIVTFKNNGLEHLVEYTPANQLFIETDSPYLAPHPFRGKTNEPAYVMYVGEKIAALKNMEKQQLASIMRQNFSNLFNISVSSQ